MTLLSLGRVEHCVKGLPSFPTTKHFQTLLINYTHTYTHPALLLCQSLTTRSSEQGTKRLVDNTIQQKTSNISVRPLYKCFNSVLITNYSPDGSISDTAFFPPFRPSLQNRLCLKIKSLRSSNLSV